MKTIVGVALTISWLSLPVSGEDWPQAAGPHGSFQVEGRAPAAFSGTLGTNVLWKTRLPNTGQATPIVSGDRIFVTSHEVIHQDTETGRDILGICLDKSTGRELWRRTIPGTRVTDLSSLFSDNTAASPVADGDRVCFVNVGGGMTCFDYAGKELWNYNWVPFGRHHARLHEPMLHNGHVITVQYPGQDLQPEHTTKAGAKPLGRDPKWWTRLQAFDMKTGRRKWIADCGTGIHHTSLMVRIGDRPAAILTGRGGSHQPPEEPYGLSLVDTTSGESIWDVTIANFPSAQNACCDHEAAYALTNSEHLTFDIQTGRLLKRASLSQGVTVTTFEDGTWVRRENVDLQRHRKRFTRNSNALAAGYHYFRSAEDHLIGRVDLKSGQVEYLQVPVQVDRRSQTEDRSLRNPTDGNWLWERGLPNDMKNADGFVATQDRRNAGDGWGHVSAASPLVVGDHIYLPTMIGTVYVLKADATQLDQEALRSVSDLGPATETWSLSSLAYADGRLYARTLKELICIGEPKSVR